MINFMVKLLFGKGLGKIKLFAYIYRLYMRRFGTKLVTVNGCKFKLRFDEGRGIGGVASCLLIEGSYEPQTTKILKSLLESGMIAFDIGANIGYYTILFGKSVGQKGRVYAFEPGRRNCEDLRANIKLNDLDNILPYELAISDKVGMMPMYVSQVEAGEHSLVSSHPQNRNTVDVGITTLDYFRFANADIIKSDTEGNEMAVLRGGRRLLSDSKNMKLVLEFLPDSLDIPGYSIDKLWTLLLNYGFNYMYLIDDRKMRTDTATLLKVQGYTQRYNFGVNVLCSKTQVKESLIC